MGSLEAWLLLRSLRTFHLRVPRQSATATALVQWLHNVATSPENSSFDGIPSGILKKVLHSSLQAENSRGWSPSKQLEGGWNATFAILVGTIHPVSLPYTSTCYTTVEHPGICQKSPVSNEIFLGTFLG